MASGWQYRITAVGGAAVLVVLAIAIANHPLVETVFRLLPAVGHLPLNQASGTEFLIETGTAVTIVVLALAPLYKPRPRRILDIWMFAVKRTFVALFALATIGYFDYTYRLPRSTLLIVGLILVMALPIWFVAIRSRPKNGENHRAIIVGDDPGEIERILKVIDIPVFGYVSSFSSYDVNVPFGERPPVTDGAGDMTALQTSTPEFTCLGGLSRLEDIFVEYDIDVAVFAFDETDREEFFGVLATCHEHGVDAKIHRDKADSVLVDDDQVEEIVDIDVEPWDWQERAVKRVFDVSFASVGLAITLPLLVAIAIAIKVDSEGSLFYTQERTAEFGETFRVYKFRTMVRDAEEQTGPKLSEEDQGGRDPRVTRVGRYLRKTHVDEIPQLWLILVGHMSVVGPRPERPELDRDIEEGVVEWRRRWFVRPGLTGLAQINNVTGHEPEQKLRFDIEYIRRQSLSFDLKIVIRQIWQVFSDIARMMARSLWN